MPQTITDGKAEFSGSSSARREPRNPDRQGYRHRPRSDDPDDSAPSASASLKVGVLSLTAQPAMVVPGQQITIQGSGFVADDSFNQRMVGGIQTLRLTPAVTANSAGDIVITINVPSPTAGRHWLRGKDRRGYSHSLQPRGRRDDRDTQGRHHADPDDQPPRHYRERQRWIRVPVRRPGAGEVREQRWYKLS